MTERELDDLLRELREELSVAPSPTFVTAVRQRIAGATGLQLQAAVGVVMALAVLTLLVLPLAHPSRGGLVIPDVPMVGRAAPAALEPSSLTAVISWAASPTSVAIAEIRSGSDESSRTDLQPDVSHMSIAAISAPVFRSDGVWVEIPAPSWTEPTYATVTSTPQQWTTVVATLEIESVAFPTIEFPRVAVIPVPWPVAGEEHQR